MRKVTVVNRQRRHRIDGCALQRLAEALLQRAGGHHDGVAILEEIVVLLLDDEQTAAVNVAALGHEGPTDVIALRYEAIPGLENGESAEVVLNVERAWQVARGAGERADRELALYLAHAIDHLCGFEDDTPAAARSMRRREWRWLRQSGVPQLFRVRSA